MYIWIHIYLYIGCWFCVGALIGSQCICLLISHEGTHTRIHTHFTPAYQRSQCINFFHSCDSFVLQDIAIIQPHKFYDYYYLRTKVILKKIYTIYKYVHNKNNYATSNHIASTTKHKRLKEISVHGVKRCIYIYIYIYTWTMHNGYIYMYIYMSRWNTRKFLWNNHNNRQKTESTPSPSSI